MEWASRHSDAGCTVPIAQGQAAGERYGVDPRQAGKAGEDLPLQSNALRIFGISRPLRTNLKGGQVLRQLIDFGVAK